MSIKSYRIADPAPQLDAGLLARFARVEAATVGHYLHDRFMRNDLRPLIDGVRIAGTAQTVSIPGPDSTLLYHAMDRVRPGDILVIDRAGDERHAAWGGFMAAVAKERGLAAVIVDGMITDPAAIIEAGVPTWARGVSPITTKLLNLGGGYNIPVSCGGVTVNPGDAILADDCGILVLPPAEVAGISDIALADQEDEGSWVARIRDGAKLQDLVDIAAMIAERQNKDGAAHG
ncbi:MULTISPECIES: RraA family protein [unclassified Shinella]|jgi:regulator of RNase E activity RraA|uniref:RraA family protein n=1 Tax=unclassified Shinella TaxID=2643062 RepID=UPI0004379EFB|nr:MULTISPECIES: dimethylmenaquinone methyltransferase [unclassified Shinella]MCA0345388.1 RraA family protein [Pseudomonadota bacterium]EYR84439.1 dimethylmenaquinone methyltransferase [Shinella sp. DD12]MCO5148854.1 RraA family protein [Shinella sp.]MDC7264913.1 RraA family protein [Shinella sp. HY16]MDC7271810.1 RraA family protein [Shinella sp. YZ44]